MVYCGKPSKGCQACRDRKTRCDRKAPACSQCVRAQRECPGYRNELDLMFRNESAAVIVKAKIKKKSRSKTSLVDPSPISSTGSDDLDQEYNEDDGVLDFNGYLGISNQATVPAGLTPTIRDRALAFFNNKSAIWLRNFNMVDSICNQTNTDRHLLASLNAVGLASYAASVRAPKLIVRARKDYITALQLTNKALQSPTEVKKDSTLFSVMALGVFETIAGSGETSLKAWSQHLHGAAELVKIRGPEQFRSSVGQVMFTQITSNLMVDCMQRSLPMPPHIIGMREATRRFVDPRDPAWNISGLIVEFTDLRAKLAQGRLTDPREVVAISQSLDRRFAEIAEHLPPSWYYKTVYTDERPDLIWKGMYHMYPNFWVSQMCNTMRTFRLHIHQIIRDQLQALEPNSDEPIFSEEEALLLYANSLSAILELQTAILASIPQHTPWKRSKTLSPGTEDLGGSRAYFILWPLYLVGVMDVTSPEKRAWILARFRDIGKTSGIEHAILLADCIEKRQSTPVWDEKTRRLHIPQKLDPYDWEMEGWAIAHGVILTAQINRSGE